MRLPYLFSVCILSSITSIVYSLPYSPYKVIEKTSRTTSTKSPVEITLSRNDYYCKITVDQSTPNGQQNQIFVFKGNTLVIARQQDHIQNELKTTEYGQNPETSKALKQNWLNAKTYLKPASLASCSENTVAAAKPSLPAPAAPAAVNAPGTRTASSVQTGIRSPSSPPSVSRLPAPSVTNEKLMSASEEKLKKVQALRERMQKLTEPAAQPLSSMREKLPQWKKPELPAVKMPEVSAPAIDDILADIDQPAGNPAEAAAPGRLTRLRQLIRGK